MEFLTEYGLFLAKVATFVVAGIILVSAVVSAAQKDKGDPEFDGELRIRKLNDSYRKLKENIEARLMSDQARKVYEKARKKERKAEKKAAKGKSGETGADEAGRPRVFVLDFDGDIKASDTDQLRRAVSAVLASPSPVGMKWWFAWKAVADWCTPTASRRRSWTGSATKVSGSPPAWTRWRPVVAT